MCRITVRRWLAGLAAGLLLAAPACDRSPAAPTPPVDPPAPQTPPTPTPEPAPQLAVERFLAFGDSLTEGESSGLGARNHDPATPGIATSFPAKLQALVDARYTDQMIHIFNGGRGGERATQARDRFVALLDALDPEVVFLMTGTNDLNAGLAFAPIITAIEDLIGIAQSRGVVVLLATIPRQVEGGSKADAYLLIDPFNEEMVDVATDEGVELVDVHAAVPEELMTPDGLHISEGGNQKIAELLLDVLRRRFEVAAGARRR